MCACVCAYVCMRVTRCKPSASIACPASTLLTGLTPGCRQYLSVLVERDQWNGVYAVTSLGVNGVNVSTPYFPCSPPALTSVRGQLWAVVWCGVGVIGCLCYCVPATRSVDGMLPVLSLPVA